MLLGFPGTSVDSEVRSLFSVFARLVCAVEDFFDRAVPPKDTSILEVAMVTLSLSFMVRVSVSTREQ